MKCIGDDRREAIDWLQDRLLVTRPEAERGMIRMLAEKVAITTDDGIFLTEEEDEAEKKGRSFSKRIQHRRVGRQMKNSSRHTIRKLGKQYTTKIVKDEDDDSKKEDK